MPQRKQFLSRNVQARKKTFYHIYCKDVQHSTTQAQKMGNILVKLLKVCSCKPQINTDL